MGRPAQAEAPARAVMLCRMEGAASEDLRDGVMQRSSLGGLQAWGPPGLVFLCSHPLAPRGQACVPSPACALPAPPFLSRQPWCQWVLVLQLSPPYVLPGCSPFLVGSSE